MSASTANMSKIFQRPASMTDARFTYCPGCSHGIVTRIIAEAIDEFDIADRTIGIAPVGCSVFAYLWYRCDAIQVAHGRACAAATGLKRARPDRIVFSYQGDGDFASIGAAESIHAANRGENITVIFINNQIYGMTGGEMAPTTLDRRARRRPTAAIRRSADIRPASPRSSRSLKPRSTSPARPSSTRATSWRRRRRSRRRSAIRWTARGTPSSRSSRPVRQTGE